MSEALPAHGFGEPDLYPERVYDDSHDEGYDSAWDLHTVYSIFKQFFFQVSVLKSQNRQLNSKQNIPMCSSVWSRLSPVFSWKFACYLCPLQHDSTLKKTLHSNVFFDIWNGNMMRNPKKISEKRVGKGQVVHPNGTSWDRLEYVGQVGQGEGGLQILVGQVEQGEGGLPPYRGTSGTRTRGLSNVIWCSEIQGIRARGHTRAWVLAAFCELIVYSESNSFKWISSLLHFAVVVKMVWSDSCVFSVQSKGTAWW